MPKDEKVETVKLVHDHAWAWFVLHAGQRMQSFNYFIVAAAFLTAGYATLLDKQPFVAAGAAIVGAWTTMWFRRLDLRTKQLISAAERVLEET